MMKKMILPLIILLTMLCMPVSVKAHIIEREQCGDFFYEYAGQAATIVGYTGAGGHVVVPRMLDGYFVESIGNKAFSFCYTIKSITLPETLTQIGDFSFSDCKNLARIEIPDNVIIIGNDAFIGCVSLQEVTIPDSVVRIEKWAFGLCKSLTSIVIPDSVDRIQDNTFFGCENLRSIVIPNSVRHIGARAFERCARLENVMIPAGVETISDQAFLACERLAAAYFYGSAPEVGDSAFDSCAGNFTVYYLEGQAGFSNPWHGWPAVPFTAVSHTVTFLDWDGAFLDSQTVTHEGAAIPPKSPSRKGHRFTGWLPAFIRVTDNLTVIAQYVEEAPVITPAESQPDGGSGKTGTDQQAGLFLRHLAGSAALLALTIIAGLFVSSVRQNRRAEK